MAGRETEYRYSFPTTHWSLIGQAGDRANDQDHRAALGELLKRYLPTLRAHLVIKKRIDVHEADDLLQGFLANNVLERNLVGAAQASRGRFRSLLATALDNYVSNERQRRGAKKRRAERAAGMSEPQERQLADEAESAEEAMYTLWGRQVLAEAVQRMRAECEVLGQSSRWRVFEIRVLQPILEGAPPLDYDEVVRSCGFASPAQASNALITAKRMFARTLREVVAEYAVDHDEVEEELRDLRRVLSSTKGR